MMGRRRTMGRRRMMGRFSASVELSEPIVQFIRSFSGDAGRQAGRQLGFQTYLLIAAGVGGLGQLASRSLTKLLVLSLDSLE